MRPLIITLLSWMLHASLIWAQKPQKSINPAIQIPNHDPNLDTLSEQKSWERLDNLLRSVPNKAPIIYAIVKKHINEGQYDTIPSRINSISISDNNPYKPLCWSLYSTQKGRLDLAMQAHKKSHLNNQNEISKHKRRRT